MIQIRVHASCWNKASIEILQRSFDSASRIQSHADFGELKDVIEKLKFANEDIALAQPTALGAANAVFQAVDTIGMPEAAINLAHGVVYLASAKKDRSSYDALGRAMEDVKAFGNLPIPLNIRNAPTKFMKELGYHKGYEMYSDKLYLPEKLKNKKYYKPKKREK